MLRDGEREIASMGPRSGERGNSKGLATKRCSLAQLQWGRALVSAEISGDPAFTLGAYWLQWGRALVSAEIWAFPTKPSIQNWLQWGRALVSAEITEAPAVPLACFTLQWGRALVSAEMERTARRARGRDTGFNG